MKMRKMGIKKYVKNKCINVRKPHVHLYKDLEPNKHLKYLKEIINHGINLMLNSLIENILHFA